MKITLPLISITSLLLLNSCQYPLLQKNGTGQTQDQQANPYGVPGQGTTLPEQGSYQEVNPPYQSTPAPQIPSVPQVTAPTPAPVASGNSSSHVIQKGDTLWGLSRQYGASVDAIRQANALDGNLIRVGQTLQIPAQ